MAHIVKGHLNEKQLKLVKLKNAMMQKKQVKLTKLELNLWQFIHNDRFDFNSQILISRKSCGCGRSSFAPVTLLKFPSRQILKHAIISA